jgi:hypothetical protein
VFCWRIAKVNYTHCLQCKGCLFVGFVV